MSICYHTKLHTKRCFLVCARIFFLSLLSSLSLICFYDYSLPSLTKITITRHEVKNDPFPRVSYQFVVHLTNTDSSLIDLFSSIIDFRELVTG